MPNTVKVPRKVFVNKTMIQSEFNGVPDKVIPRKESLVKGSEVKFHIFDGWVDYPIYFTLDELDKTNYKNYNRKKYLYIYFPEHSGSDAKGILKYEVVGVTKRKSTKDILFIVKEKDFRGNDYHQYYRIDGENIISHGPVFTNTLDGFNKSDVGDEYKGYRNAKWIKLDLDEYSDKLGKVYQYQKSL
jgi:hypothetical protein